MCGGGGINLKYQCDRELRHPEAVTGKRTNECLESNNKNKSLLYFLC